MDPQTNQLLSEARRLFERADILYRIHLRFYRANKTARAQVYLSSSVALRDAARRIQGGAAQVEAHARGLVPGVSLILGGLTYRSPLEIKNGVLHVMAQPPGSSAVFPYPLSADYELGRGRIYLATLDKDGKPERWQDSGPCKSFKLTLDPGTPPKDSEHGPDCDCGGCNRQDFP